MDKSATIEQDHLSEKEKLWKKTEEEVDNIEKVDIHGVGIDPKIKRTAIALNVLGIDTSMSCEGHLDHGRGAPYIDISARGTAKLRLDADNAYALQRHADHERLQEESISINRKLLDRLQGYLDGFYREREVQQVHRLMAEMNSYGVIRLRNFGELAQGATDSSERSVNLTAFQHEMEEFGKFLEEKFFRE